MEDDIWESRRNRGNMYEIGWFLNDNLFLELSFCIIVISKYEKVIFI